MVQALPKSLTLSDFLDLPETKPASEFINGQITQKFMPQGQHSRIQQKISSVINFALEDRKIALALTELRCNFGSRSVVPDVVVFQWQSLATNPDGAIVNQFNIPPDWVIEILSPDQSGSRDINNILFCLVHSSQMGWLIDPQEKLIFVYTPNQIPMSFEQNDKVLPVPSFAQDLQLNGETVFSWLKVL
jgi:Uma2 family endonuclease